MQTTDEVKTFIEKNLLATKRFTPQIFDFSATLFRVPLSGSFVGTLINGVEPEVNFRAGNNRRRHNEIFRWLRKLTGNEIAYWFYVVDGTGGKSSLSWSKQARFEADGEAINAPLQSFEREPATVGSGAFLGLLGGGGKWLLLHSHYPDQEFEISIHGPVKLCNDLCRLLKCSGEQVEAEE